MILKIVLSLCFFTLTSSEFVCPDKSIYPEFQCLCDLVDYSLVACNFQYNSQANINIAFPILRKANNLTDDEYLTFDNILLTNPGSELATFNLAPLALTNVTTLGFSVNKKVSEFVGGTNSTEEIDIQPFRFSARVFEATRTAIGDSSIFQVLKFIDNERLEYLEVYMNKIQTTPDLSSFKNLVVIDLSNNLITKVGSGNFKGLPNLMQLNLNTNLINELEEGAFQFGPFEEESRDATKDLFTAFQIGLAGNNLTDEKIHLNHGLDTSGRETWVILSDNRFEFISQEKFEKILLAHPLNFLIFFNNFFICDQRMAWLKHKKDEYETRVHGMECINDVGQTVFTTDLIS